MLPPIPPPSPPVAAPGSPARKIEPFDRHARRRVRGRAAASYADFAFLKHSAADELAARAASFERRWERILDLGAHDGSAGARVQGDLLVSTDASFRFARGLERGVVCDEDRLPFTDSSFDLVLSALSLHSVNDLPGALVQIRRILRPGGVFLACFVGGASFAPLRHALIEAELAEGGGAAPRLLPMVDPREAPGLMQRAGFGDPVVDVTERTVRYREAAGMLRDIRGMGEGNILRERSRTPLTRERAEAVMRAVDGLRDGEDRIPLTLELITLTGRV